MSVWNNVPLASQIVSVTQAPIQENFTNTNIWFGVDHVPINGTNNFGKHAVIQSVQQSLDPTVLGTDIALYNKAVSGVNQFFVRRVAGSVQQLTGVIPVGATTGYTWNFADGLQIRTGTINCTFTNNVVVPTTVTFQSAFPTACIGVIINQYSISNTIFSTALSPATTGCTISTYSAGGGSGTVSIFYIAIGN